MTDNLIRIHHEEERIRGISLKLIDESKNLSECLDIILFSLDTIFSLNQIHFTSDEDGVSLQFLGIRMFNTVTAASKLAYSGYYQSAYMLVRDLVETGYLLDYFTIDKSLVTLWRTLTDKERKDKFKQVLIREALDKRDQFTSKKRQQIYSMLSDFASHPTYKGGQLVSKDGFGIIGPFFDESKLRSYLEDVSQFLPLFTLIYTSHFDDESLLTLKVNFLNRCNEWI